LTGYWLHFNGAVSARNAFIVLLVFGVVGDIGNVLVGLVVFGKTIKVENMFAGLVVFGRGRSVLVVPPPRAIVV